jgi:hypothetical protein
VRKTGFGISVDVPTGWASSIHRRPVDAPLDAPFGATPSPDARGLAPQAPLEPRERTLPVVHLCSRPIPAGVGDFGAGAIEVLGAEDVFVMATVPRAAQVVRSLGAETATTMRRRGVVV